LSTRTNHTQVIRGLRDGKVVYVFSTNQTRSGFQVASDLGLEGIPFGAARFGHVWHTDVLIPSEPRRPGAAARPSQGGTGQDASTEEAMTSDDNLADRQAAAHIRILHVLRELRLVDVPSVCPVVAALAASMLFRVPPKDRPQVGRELDRQIVNFLQATPAGVIPDHDA
jgi:hypothetical protein